MKTVKAAFNSLVDQFKPGGIDRALFTSFNFSAKFFERNVLPMLVDSELSDGAELDALQINDALRNTAVTVICDRSTNPRPKGNYRYGLLPVGLSYGFFHPKLIMLSGVLLDGSYGVKLMVGSCNITLSGWGINREVVGITDVGAQQAKELQPLLSWISDHANKLFSDYGGVEEGNIRQCLSQWLTLLEGVDSLADDMPDLYVRIPNAESESSFINEIFAQQQFSQCHIVSPFWSEYKESQALLDQIGAENITLTPSINNKGEWSFPEKFRDAVLGGNNQFGFSSFKNRDRYTHAKSLYAWNTAGQAVLISGSANFTQAALGAVNQGNVEAVLKYSIKHDKAWESQFVDEKIDRINWTEQANNDEHAPELVPFDMHAVYDWTESRLKVRLHCTEEVFKQIKSIRFNQELLNFTLNTENVYVTNIQANLRGVCPPIEVLYQDTADETLNFTVLVSQLNGEDDQLGYLPKPQLGKIIDQLRKLDPTIGSRPHSDRISGNEGGDLDGEAIIDVEYDFFSIFQATYKLKESYLEGGNKDKNPFDKHAPYSLALIYRALALDYEETIAVAKGNMDVYFIRYYIFLSELLDCCEKLKHLDRTEVSALLISAINSDIESVDHKLLTLITSSPVLNQFLPNGSGEPLLAETLRSWFFEQLRGQC